MHKTHVEMNVHKDLKKTSIVTVVFLFVLKEQQEIQAVTVDKNVQ